MVVQDDARCVCIHRSVLHLTVLFSAVTTCFYLCGDTVALRHADTSFVSQGTRSTSLCSVWRSRGTSLVEAGNMPRGCTQPSTTDRIGIYQHCYLLAAWLTTDYALWLCPLAQPSTALAACYVAPPPACMSGLAHCFRMCATPPLLLGWQQTDSIVCGYECLCALFLQQTRVTTPPRRKGEMEGACVCGYMPL